MEVKTLSTGWTLLRRNPECWAQVPPGYDWENGVDDDYIFNPEWHRECWDGRDEEV